MRTDEAILNEKFRDNLPAEFEGKIWDEKLLAAMKEAREEYGEKLLEWFSKLTPVEKVTVWGETKGVFNMTNGQLIKKFNTHLAAIEAEKERGKG